MKKVFLVIHELGIINDVLKDRIRSLGRSYVFWNNHWLVETDLTAEEIYHRIACDIFERQAFFKTSSYPSGVVPIFQST